MDDLLKRKVVGPVPGQSPKVAQPRYAECATLKRFPVLAEFLTRIYWDAKTPRETGTMMVFAEDGKLKCCLHDRDGDLTCFVTAETLQGLFEAVEKGFAEDKLDWRRKRNGVGGRGR